MTLMAEVQEIDPSKMSLPDLRSVRQQLQTEDDAVSYVRRIAQARLDIVRCYLRRLDGGGDCDANDIAGELQDVLAQSLTSGEARPPRPVADIELDPIADELDTICAVAGFSRVQELSEDELRVLEERLATFEARISENRQARYKILDVLNAELVTRYRDGAKPPGL